MGRWIVFCLFVEDSNPGKPVRYSHENFTKIKCIVKLPFLYNTLLVLNDFKVNFKFYFIKKPPKLRNAHLVQNAQAVSFNNIFFRNQLNIL